VADKHSAEKQDGSSVIVPSAQSHESPTNHLQGDPVMLRLHLSAAVLAAALTIGTVASAQERPAANRPANPEVSVVALQPPPPPPRGVAIEEVLARVAASTGKKFFVDPRVRASVFAVPELETPTYAELLTILRMHGFSAAEVGGRVNIVPDANARFMPSRLLQRDDPSVPDDEYVTRILTVPNAAGLVPILRPLMPQSAHLASMPALDGESQEGKLILFDTYANVRRMTEIINTLVR
jgi:type II secretory pathway component GspD/PulD (secretin)